MFIVTAEEMRELDRHTIEGIGLPGTVLMENAGIQVANKLKQLAKGTSDKIIILAGHGNNGGDGFVIARHLGNHGYDVETWFVGDIRKSSEESMVHFHALVHAGYKLKFWDQANDELLRERLQQADFIVDALLGIGVQGALREPIKSIVEVVNQTDALRIAVDIATGVNTDTGQIENIAFRADYTITFAYPKLGQLLYPGADYTGELIIVDISIPPIVTNHYKLNKSIITTDLIHGLLPARRPDSHKGTYGHALIIGGSRHMPGAPTLATMGAMKAGAGLTTVAVPDMIQQMVFPSIPEAICMGVKCTNNGFFSIEGIETLEINNDKYSALGIGPGIGRWEQDIAWLDHILTTANQPLVIDADALNMLATDLSLLNKRKKPTILTPHPGEMARLLNESVAYVQQNRVKVTADLAEKYGVFVVLKGAHTVISTPDGDIFINGTGGPSLAKGGSGDVLTGMITGFLAQRLQVRDAVLLGVYLHGLAGELAGIPSDYSALATDIVDQIGQVIQGVTLFHA